MDNEFVPLVDMSGWKIADGLPFIDGSVIRRAIEQRLAPQDGQHGPVAGFQSFAQKGEPGW